MAIPPDREREPTLPRELPELLELMDLRDEVEPLEPVESGDLLL